MTLRLTVQRQAWLDHVAATVAAYAPVPVVPVVKGNGYGFGRHTLFPVVTDAADMVCVGTVHELDGVPDTLTTVVLTPHPDGPVGTAGVVTVGQVRDTAHLDPGQRVLVKLRSSMRRYGTTPDQLGSLLDAIEARRGRVEGASIHLPLAGDDQQRYAEVTTWAAHLPPGLPLWVSHLEPASAHRLATDLGRSLVVRLGTRLWHGDKSFLHLGATVIDTVPVAAGQVAGYRHTPAPGDGTLVLVGAGSAHGVTTLVDGRSPLHFARRRLALLEAPHMHTTMAFVPDGDPTPQPGDVIDVQRPLITTTVDEVRWV